MEIVKINIRLFLTFFLAQLILVNFLFPETLFAQEGNEKWSFETGGSVISSPAIDSDGAIYVGSTDNKLYAVNPDGSSKWVFQLPTSAIDSSPAIGSDGTIYVGSYDFYLYAINPDGTQKWKYRTGGYITASPAIGADGTIYVGSGGYGTDFKLYAINPDGTLKWAFDCPILWSSPAIGIDGTIYVGSTDGAVYAVNPGGTQKWKFQAGDYIYSSPAVGYDGTIYVGANNAKMYAINPDGSQKWAFGTESSPYCTYFSPAVGSDGTIYVGSEFPDNKLYAVNPDGTQKWMFDSGEIYLSTPAIDGNGIIYVGSRDRKLHAVNPDGTQRWAYETGAFVHSSPTIGSDGTVYVGSYDHRLYAIESASDGPADSPWPMFHNNLRHTGCPDSDGDGMFDNWEQRYFGGLSENESGDYDNDGLNNQSEFSNFTSPADDDSDDDGMPDGWEVLYHLDPLENDAAEDADGDGLSNLDEYLNGFDPNLKAPEIQFSVEPSTGFAPLTVSFQINASGEIANWYWDFGDGVSSYAQNPLHTYFQHGTFTINLSVTGPGGSDDFSVPVTIANPPPVADAGPDQTVDEGTQVLLNGSNSDDPINDIVAYQWTQVSGSPVTIIDDMTVQASFMAPDVGPGGEVLSFQLAVTDSSGLESTDTCAVTVAWINLPPVADAGPNQIADEGVLVALSGLNSHDPDDGIETYHWMQIGGKPVSLSDQSAVDPSFTAPDVGPNGEALVFQLTITDTNGLVADDTCIVNVTWVNISPVANAGLDQTVTEGVQVILSGVESFDSDDGIGAYQWTQIAGSPVQLSNPVAVYPTFTAPDVGPDGEALSFQLTVTDTGGLKSTDTCIVNVSWDNLPPVADAGADQTVSEGLQVILNGFGSSDPDDGIGAYQWTQITGPPVQLSDPVAVYPTFTAPDVDPDGESLTFQLTVIDKGGLKSTDICIINVSWENLAPTADAGPDQTVTEGIQVVLYGVESSDPDDGIASYQWVQIAGPSVQLSNPVAVYPTFTAPDVGPDGEALSFQLTVTDTGGLKSTDTCIVNVSWDNLPPVADAGADQTVGEGLQVILNGFGSSDPDDGIGAYQWIQIAGAPVQLSDPSSIYPAFIAPNVGPDGEALTFQLTVTDRGGLKAVDTCIINVSWNNLPPIADAGPDQTVGEGLQVILNGFGSTDPDDGVSTYQWTQTAGIPVQLSDNSAVYPTFIAPNVDPDGSALIFQLTVTDTGGLKSTDTCIINVTWDNVPPVADAGPDQMVSEGIQVVLNGSGSSDSDDGISSYHWMQTFGKPVTLSDPAAASSSFTAPDVGPDGEFLIFQLSVTDPSGFESTDTCFVTISWVNQPPTADAGADQSVTEGVLVTLNGSNSYDSDNGIVSYHWRQIDGPAVYIAGADSIQASITTPDVGADGTFFQFELQVNDSEGLSAVDQVFVNVTWSNSLPVADAGPNQSVSPSGLVSLDGSNSYDRDGIAAYLWKQMSGPEVSLSDSGAVNPIILFSGIDSTEASLLFELTVTDTGGLKATDSVIVNVLSGNRPPIADAGLNRKVGPRERVMLDGLNSRDPDGAIAYYAWKQVGGPTVALSNPNYVRPVFLAPDVGIGGSALVFELTVADQGGIQNSDTVIVNVTSKNLPPIADAETLVPQTSEDMVSLTGTASYDPDGTIVDYCWRQINGPTAIFSDPSTVNPTLSFPDYLSSCVSMEFELTVRDDNGLSDTDTTTVNICDLYAPPVADAGSDLIVEESNTVSLDASNSYSSDYEPITYDWKQVAGPQVTLSNASFSQPTFIAPVVDIYGAELIFQLKVKNHRQLCSVSEVSVFVRDNGLLDMPRDVIFTTTYDGQSMFIQCDESASLVRLEAINPQDIKDEDRRPGNLIFGLVDIQIKVAKPGDTVSVTYYLPEPVPGEFGWFKWNESSGWLDYSPYAQFNTPRDMVTITLTDGGNGDDDEMVNSMIIDPAGLGMPTSDSSSDNGGGGGCFIGSSITGFTKVFELLKKYFD